MVDGKLQALHPRQRIAGGVGQQPVQALADHRIAIEGTGAQAHQALGMPIGHAAMQAQTIKAHFLIAQSIA